MARPHYLIPDKMTIALKSARGGIAFWVVDIVGLIVGVERII